MSSPDPYDLPPSARWASTPPPEPPYVDGPLRLWDPVRPAPPSWTPPAATAVPAPLPPAPPRTHRVALVALVALLAVTLFAGAFGVTKVLIGDTTTTASPPVTVPAPTKRPTTPSTTTPPTTTPTDPRSGGSTDPSTDPSADPTPDLSAQAATVTPGIVNIVSRMPAGIGAGTGIVISADGTVVTNNHVVEGATQIQATEADSGETYAATIVGTDPVHDVAVLHLAAAEGMDTVPIGDSDTVRVGDAVAAVGNAGGVGGEPTVATGHVIALHQPVTATDEAGGGARTLTDLIEVDAFVQSGDSGGPLVSEDAEVIGIDVAASVGSTRAGDEQPHVGFAIPINRVMSIAEDIQANPQAPSGSTGPALGSGYLGVSAVDSTTTEGASVTAVQPNSPAEQAGLQAGDVITAVDSTPIAASADLVDALSQLKGGDTAEITWQASDGMHHATVSLASR